MPAVIDVRSELFLLLRISTSTSMETMATIASVSMRGEKGMK